MIRLLHRGLLWIITAITPVFIAACYGAQAVFAKAGRVVDQETGDGIAGVQVTCVVDPAEGSTTVVTDEEGKFVLDYAGVCNSVRVEDVDGPANGGEYETLTTAFCEDCVGLAYSLTKKN